MSLRPECLRPLPFFMNKKILLTLELIISESVTLDCKYTTASPSQELFWYIQRTDESPKLVLQRKSYGGGINGTEFQERFYSESTTSQSSTELTIRSVTLSDSARYYSAVMLCCTGTDSILIKNLN
uniref:Ig-like domain-containing protein n=1 Tax=Sinocyclocheilus rhinocerous TaxID=307959 RepID=A0A673JGQ8_9TELE